MVWLMMIAGAEPAPSRASKNRPSISLARNEVLDASVVHHGNALRRKPLHDGAGLNAGNRG
jgi:hypothetical protein